MNMRFFTRFFSLRQYSTAKKIIDSVEERIILYLTNHNPKIRGMEKKYNHNVGYAVSNKSDLIKALGDVLTKQLPDPVYDKYQQLKTEDKIIFRNTIRNTYFDIIREYNLENSIPTNNAYNSNKEREYSFVIIRLPNFFYDTKRLSIRLNTTISSVRQELISKENELIQSANVL